MPTIYEPNSLAALPIIIDGPGQYITRSGKTAYIDKVRTENSAPGVPCPTFAAAGHVTHKRTRGDNQKFTTWHVSGRNRALGTHASDIVRKEIDR